MRTSFILRVLVALFVMIASEARADTPNIAAASDLQLLLPELAQAFKQKRGQEVRLVMGSSGNLARQIQAGAPFELFMSADESFVEFLVKAGRAEDAGVLYAIGSLALVVPSQSKIELDPNLAGLGQAIAAGTVRRLAIANPDLAPYGRAARAALQSSGHWATVQPRLVLGESVSQAAQFVVTGAVDGALVSAALLRSPALADKTRHAIVASALYPQIRQRMVLVKGAGSSARAFYAFLQGDEARALFTRHGFERPTP
ncbi:MAG: molybdate ABC transporter substrate-binding protein [Burkholderiales bacterium]